MSLTRYGSDYRGDMTPLPSGDWVKADEALAEIAKRNNLIKELLESVQRLKPWMAVATISNEEQDDLWDKTIAFVEAVETKTKELLSRD